MEPCIKWIWNYLVLPFLFIPLMLFSARAEDQPLATRDQQTTYNLRGYFSTRYVFRTAKTPDERIRDNDVHEQVRFDLSPEAEKGYEFHMLATGRQELDGNQSRRNFYPLEDIGDAQDHRWSGYLYEAHLDVDRPLPFMAQIRIGRQSGTRDDAVSFDGVAGDFDITQDLSMTVYGGIPVHLYELNNEWGEDRLAGLGIDYLLENLSFSLDYLYTRDERDFFSQRDQEDHQFSFKLWKRLFRYSKAMGRFRYLNDEAKDLQVRMMNTFPSANIEFTFTYFRQFQTLNELSNELSSFYDVLGPSHPFQSFDLKARKFFGRHVALDVGYFERDFTGSRSESALNHEYKRFFTVLGVSDVPIKGLSCDLTAEYWESESEYTSGGLDLEYQFTNVMKKMIIGIGTYYSLYKYDYYGQLGEREEVRTYYVRGKVPLADALSLNVSYEYEDSLETYQTAKIGMRYDF